MVVSEVVNAGPAVERLDNETGSVPDGIARATFTKALMRSERSAWYMQFSWVFRL